MNRRNLIKSAASLPFLGLVNLASQNKNKSTPQMFGRDFVIPEKLYMTPESFNDFKNWEVYELDELTRKEIYHVNQGRAI